MLRSAPTRYSSVVRLLPFPRLLQPPPLLLAARHAVAGVLADEKQDVVEPSEQEVRVRVRLVLVADVLALDADLLAERLRGDARHRLADAEGGDDEDLEQAPDRADVVVVVVALVEEDLEQLPQRREVPSSQLSRWRSPGSWYAFR
jgi:hypothetical protein